MRRRLLAVRRDVRDRESAAVAAADRIVAALPTAAGTVVAGYHPIGDEFDCRPATAALAASGAQLCLPVTAMRGDRLIFRQWKPGEALMPGPFGTSHPLASAPVVEPDVLLVPLLAFDRRGHRLGYGAGYYDRTLAALRKEKSIISIGLSFNIQEVDEVPFEPCDEPLDMIVTENRTLSFNATASG